MKYQISCLPVPNLSNTSDRAIWRDTNGNEKSFSVKQVWEDYKESETKVNWQNLVWYTQRIPSHSCVMDGHIGKVTNSRYNFLVE